MYVVSRAERQVDWLDILTNQNPKHNTKQKEHNFQPRIINLSDIRLTKEQIQALFLGPNYTLETTYTNTG